MNWTNVKLILMREVRDQLRDRRTLFMIAVLPLLLYPLLGMSFFQVAQFMRERPTKALIVGLPDLEGLPPLVDHDQFAANLFTNPERARLLKLTFRGSAQPAVDEDKQPRVARNKQARGSQSEPSASPAAPARPVPAGADRLPDQAETAAAQAAVRQGAYELVIEFPSDFAARLEQFRARLHDGESAAAERAPLPVEVPSPEIFYNTAKESSQIAYLRVNEILTRWTDAIGRQNLKESRIPPTAAKPFTLAVQDVAEAGHRKAALWSKILPFVLLLWALTGAFYPAVDLCAGEKERGTLETLLSSPAERREIVWGKLLTVMLFSIATALLNLLSMGITGSFVVRQLDFGPPPPLAIVWLLIALVPTSALFSGLCLALAAFARSTKEGQYYLMPLVLVTMPLTILPMSPGVELNLGNSLIPITGMVLLLRTLLEGNYAQALPYVPLVVAVTLTCCLLAVRWAADQFNSESVLFRESERLDMGLWLRRLVHDREDTPSVAEAVFCGVLILMIKFFLGLAITPRPGFSGLVQMVMAVQLVVIATPALIMTIMLTRSPAQTLLLRRPSWAAVPAALLLAVAVHPLVAGLQRIVMHIYPVSDDVQRELTSLFSEDGPLGMTLLVFAVAPALCEELAFRGFILSGLRHMGHKWRAIILSSILFGAMHSIFQQSIITCIVGTAIGFIAVQTGSLLPAIVFHVVHNSLVVLSKYLPAWLERNPALRWVGNVLTEDGQPQVHYSWQIVAISALSSMLLLAWFQRLPYSRTAEEKLQEAIDQQAAQPAA